MRWSTVSKAALRSNNRRIVQLPESAESALARLPKKTPTFSWFLSVMDPLNQADVMHLQESHSSALDLSVGCRQSPLKTNSMEALDLVKKPSWCGITSGSKSINMSESRYITRPSKQILQITQNQDRSIMGQGLVAHHPTAPTLYLYHWSMACHLWLRYCLSAHPQTKCLQMTVITVSKWTICWRKRKKFTKKQILY